MIHKRSVRLVNNHYHIYNPTKEKHLNLYHVHIHTLLHHVDAHHATTEYSSTTLTYPTHTPEAYSITHITIPRKYNTHIHIPHASQTRNTTKYEINQENKTEQSLRKVHYIKN